MRRLRCFFNLVRYRKLDDHPISYKTAWEVAGIIANGAKKRRAKNNQAVRTGTAKQD